MMMSCVGGVDVAGFCDEVRCKQMSGNDKEVLNAHGVDSKLNQEADFIAFILRVPQPFI